MADNIPDCDCGIMADTAISKSSKNPNRPFYACSQRQCKFFAWVDGNRDNLIGPSYHNQKRYPPRNQNYQKRRKVSPDDFVTIVTELKQIGSELQLIRKIMETTHRSSPDAPVDATTVPPVDATTVSNTTVDATTAVPVDATV
jgi:hypothetical protein